MPLNLDHGVETLQSTVSIFMQETKRLVCKDTRPILKGPRSNAKYDEHDQHASCLVTVIFMRSSPLVCLLLFLHMIHVPGA
jgi:hypothetical protein